MLRGLAGGHSEILSGIMFSPLGEVDLPAYRRKNVLSQDTRQPFYRPTTKFRRISWPLLVQSRPKLRSETSESRRNLEAASPRLAP